MIGQREHTDTVMIYFIDSTGVHLSHSQRVGLEQYVLTSDWGQFNFSPDGRTFVRFGPRSGVEIFAFDRTTGMLSDFQHIAPLEADTIVEGLPSGGVAISPNNRFLYTCTSPYLRQYDLHAPDIAASMVRVGDLLAENTHGTFYSAMSELQLGPDCRLYAFSWQGDSIHVIDYPNEKGADCGWRAWGQSVGHVFFRDWSYFPNFRLGPLGDEGEPCTPRVRPITSTIYHRAPLLKVDVFPNPARSFVDVRLPATMHLGQPGRCLTLAVNGCVS